MTGSAAELRAIEAEVTSCYLAVRPLAAAVAGDAAWADQLLPVVSADAENDLAARIGRARARLAALDPAALPADDQLTLSMMTELTGYDVDALTAHAGRYTVSPVPEAGLAAALLLFLPEASMTSDAELERYAEAVAAIPAVLSDSLAELASGRAAGQHPVARLAERAVGQIEEYLATPPELDPFAAAAVAAHGPQADRLSAELLRTVIGTVRPAFGRYRDALADDVLPRARDASHAGLTWLPGGHAAYRTAVRAHTTLDVEPLAAHDEGLALIGAIQHRAEDIAASMGWDASFARLRDRLRADEALYFSTAEQMLAAADTAMQRALAAVPAWICDPPAATCEVRPMSALETRNGVLGRYQAAPLDRHSPGAYWLNTAGPARRPVYEAEALAHHESVPGHHIEIAKSQEAAIDSPFRRVAEVTPYREGWALYTEQLADDIGLYTGPLDRLGMLSFQLWRAGRLVVDTGLHELGWSRDQAIGYLWDNTILTRGNVENEVDRYIACPGQALGYMTGQLAFERLRTALVRDSSSPAQNRAFHSCVLEHGPLSLGCLGRSLGVELAVLS
jgi:uncharacterized protein (DUF885 family)